MAFANQYSFLLITALILFVTAAVQIYRHARWRTVLTSLVVVGLVIGAAYAALRPGASDVDSLEAAESVIANGQPTMVEFFSNYCAGCLAARPAVDSLVTEIQTRYSSSFNVLRVDIHTPFGRELRERYGFSYTPEFVLFDPAGQEVWRSHVPPSLAEIETLTRVADAA
jgi:thiol-disulfide isomerase/thioredoxin